MKLWVDDVRPAPKGQNYIVCKRVNAAKQIIQYCETMEKHYKAILEVEDLPERVRSVTEKNLQEITLSLIDIDHDAGDFACDGGDYIWEWKDFKRSKRRNIKNLKRLARLMRKEPTMEVYFYDSW